MPNLSDLFVVRRNGYYYRPNSCGYTGVLSQAGLYTLAEAQAAVQEVDDAHYKPLREELQTDLLPRMGAAMVASCTCGTKTPEIEYHATNCRYRVLKEAADLMDRLIEGKCHEL